MITYAKIKTANRFSQSPDAHREPPVAEKADVQLLELSPGS